MDLNFPKKTGKLIGCNLKEHPEELVSYFVVVLLGQEIFQANGVVVCLLKPVAFAFF